MDKNSIAGILLIAAIMFGWLYFTSPSKEEQEKRKRYQDSIAVVTEKAQTKSITEKKPGITSTLNDTIAINDSVEHAQLLKKYGPFAEATKKTNEFFTIENELLKATISTKGGRVCKVLLKEYKRYGGDPLELFDADSSAFGLMVEANANKYNTNEFYFTPVGSSFKVTDDKEQQLAMRLYTGADKYIEYIYSLKGNSYIVGCKVNLVGINDILPKNTNILTLHWATKTPRQEKDVVNERSASTIHFKYADEKPDYISESENETKALEAKTKWIAFKQQFFTAILIADDGFDKTGAAITTLAEGDSSRYVKSFSANLGIPYSHKPHESFGMQFYFGPNHYQTLKKYDIGLEKQISLGWGIFGWLNRFIVIPTFNFLDSFGLNYGIIILILTLILKALLYPIAYKTYISSAKMRILKPEVDEINKKYEKDDPLKKQQAMMQLYRKAGVNPMAGCIPVLLQMPILMALLRFFPASIELRQQPFLWADDLSTYDSIYNFGFHIPGYGDHISLFALLMTASTILYTWSNSQLMGNTQQMPGMKFMMYAMPIIFLIFLNSYSAGLSYYYFLANMITFGQTYLMRKFVDEEALHLKIQENKKKPVKVSRFQQRLEEMQKARTEQTKKK